MSYIAHLVVLFMVYATLALSLNWILGYCGLFSLCHGALFGLGAYASALLVTKTGTSFALGWTLAILVGALASLFISILAGRFKGDAFALSTLVFQVAVIEILNNAVELTGGPFGIVGIPRPSVFAYVFSSAVAFAFLAIVVCLVVVCVSWLLVRSPFGLSLTAIRDDELAAKALGKNVFKYRVVACAVAGAFAGLAGAVYASYIGYIDPSGFRLGESFVILSMVLLGGAGNLRGPVLGAALVIALPELLRFTTLPSTIAPNIQQMIFGAALIAVMFARPQGLWGQYRQD